MAEHREENKRADAERWLSIATKLLVAKDLIGSRRFALRAQEKDPQWEGVDQVLAIVDVLVAAEKRINNHMDWYAILQLEPRSDDLELIKRQYKRFALFLHPDKNQTPFAVDAFKLVSDAWSVLSDETKKGLYDNELNLLSKLKPVVLDNPSANTHQSQEAQPKKTARRSTRGRKRKSDTSSEPARASTNSRLSSFWTSCPYCYHLYEYPMTYVNCVLRCQTCKRGFHAAEIRSPPPAVLGKDAYYCSWAFFPIGYSKDSAVPNGSPFSHMFSKILKAGAGMGAAVTVDSDSEKEGHALDDSDVSWEVGKEKEKKSGTPKKSPMKEKENGSAEVKGTANGGVGMYNNVSKPGVRKKTVAMRPKRQARKTIAGMAGIGAMGEIGGRFDAESVHMDLNEEAEVDEPVVDVGGAMGTESIEKEATEGIGFFEGLDDLIGTLPILTVAPEQQVEDT